MMSDYDFDAISVDDKRWTAIKCCSRVLATQIGQRLAWPYLTILYSSVHNADIMVYCKSALQTSALSGERRETAAIEAYTKRLGAGTLLNLIL